MSKKIAIAVLSGVLVAAVSVILVGLTLAVVLLVERSAGLARTFVK